MTRLVAHLVTGEAPDVPWKMTLTPLTLLQELRRVAAEELDTAEGQLNAEADEDAGLRSQHGGAWNRPASAALNSSLREKVASYRRAGQRVLSPRAVHDFAMAGQARIAIAVYRALVHRFPLPCLPGFGA